MANPRAIIHQLGIGNQFMPVAFDSTINLPTIQMPGPGPNVSSDLGAAVTWSELTVSVYTTGTATDLFTVGKGNSGDPVMGVVIHVDPDGFGSVLYKGTWEVVPNVSNPPSQGGLVAVDGAGKVIASTAAKNANCRCIGFAPSYNQQLFQHLQGNISPPTTTLQTGSVEYCQIYIS